MASVPNSSYNISYHNSDAEAQTGLNAISGSIENTSSPQTIYVRIEDVDNGCLAFSNFDLIVNPLPTINDPTPLEVCDGEEAVSFFVLAVLGLDWLGAVSRFGPFGCFFGGLLGAANPGAFKQHTSLHGSGLLG